MTPARANILGRLQREGSVALSDFTLAEALEARAAVDDAEAMYLTSKRHFVRVPNTGIALRTAEAAVE